MRERLTEYSTVNRQLIADSQRIIQARLAGPLTNEQAVTIVELQAQMHLLEQVLNDLDKILRGEQLDLHIREFEL